MSFTQNKNGNDPLKKYNESQFLDRCSNLVFLRLSRNINNFFLYYYCLNRKKIRRITILFPFFTSFLLRWCRFGESRRIKRNKTVDKTTYFCISLFFIKSMFKKMIYFSAENVFGCTHFDHREHEV